MHISQADTIKGMEALEIIAMMVENGLAGFAPSFKVASHGGSGLGSPGDVSPNMNPITILLSLIWE